MTLKAKFGPAGNSQSFYDAGHRHSNEMPGYLKEMGLDWYEYSCGKGVRMKSETAVEIGTMAIQNDILMSVHAPYYINLANPDPEKRERSREYVYETLELAKLMQAKRVVVHTGSARGKKRSEALLTAIGEIRTILREKNERGFSDIVLCPETLGKLNQLGSLDEILEMCGVADELLPTIDFGHIHSRGSGCIKTQEDYAAILDAIENALGEERLKKIHIHFSHQEYTASGERRHLTFEDKQYGPFFEPLSREMVKRGLHPVIVCESAGVMAEDALKMKKMYERDLITQSAVL